MKRILSFFLIYLFFSNTAFAFAEENIRYIQVDGVVNMRSEATTDSLIVYQLKNDMKVNLLKSKDDWSYISYNGVKGYILSDFLFIKEKVDVNVTQFSFHTLGTHTVKQGDTVKNISVSYSIPIKELLKTNQLNDDGLSIGQILKVSKNKHLEGKKIVIDPGHGGNETGASYNGLKENEETMQVALKLKRHLEAEGAKVFLTLDENFSNYLRVPLTERARFAWKVNADLFVSIHFNTNSNKQAKGTETYYNRNEFEGSKNPFPDHSERLANYIQKYLVSSIDTDDLGTKESNFHVLRNNSVPSVLVEVGFLSNADEAEIVRTNAFKEKTALGITQGIIHYFKK